MPLVSLVMLIASRIGTPAEISVPSVRVKRAIDVLDRIAPRMGILSLIRSMPYLPPSLSRISLMSPTTTNGVAMM